MQILYWHLTRPQTSTCGGGSLSPPLLQRRESGPSLPSVEHKISTVEESDNINQLHQNSEETKTLLPNQSSLANPGKEAGEHCHSRYRAMEIENDDQMPTFYLLNSIDLPEDDDSALNHHLNLIHGHRQNSHDGAPYIAVGNGSSGDGGGGGDGGDPPGGHYSDQSRKTGSNKRKKRRSNELARVLSIEDESDGDDDSFVNIGPSKSKKAKLIVNLYSEDKGYSFGYQVPGSTDCNESHSIPYNERYLLESLDHEQIPNKLLCKYEDREGVCLMRYRNQVIAEIRDYRKSSLLSSNNNSNGNTTSNQLLSSPSVNRNNNNVFSVNGSVELDNEGNTKPIVRQIMLRPTTESLLCDFDMLVEKGQQDKGGWNAVLKQSLLTGDSAHLISDGSDSEYEYEVDLEASQKNHCNSLSFDQRLELERKFVNSTAGPLCLDPSPQVSVIANRMQFEKLKWNTEEMNAAAKRWEENPFKTKILISNPDTSLNAPSMAEGRLNIEPFLNYVLNIRAKKELSSSHFGTVDKDFIRLPIIAYQDYPSIEPPTNIEEILRIGQPPEPSQIRIFPNENFVRKIEEYVLETERRKRPHTTTLSIFQRNGMESYFGELEMESFLDPTQPRIGNAPASTKCQFELGSTRNVSLYVKQFSDIFTEDGRRPCKITYQKVGQAPQVVYTNSYKSATPTATTTQSLPVTASGSTAASQAIPSQNTSAVTVTNSVPQSVVTLVTTSGTPASQVSAVPTTTGTGVSPMVVVASTPQVVQTIVTSSSNAVTVPGAVSVQQQQSPQQQAQIQRPSTPASAPGANPPQPTTTTPSLPPVQIVHPQPRTTPQVQQQQQQKSQLTAGQQRQTPPIQVYTQQPNQAQNIATSQPTSQPSANVNLNVNLTPQQVLTRPVVNMNLQQQQAVAQQQLMQLAQQRILRMKQQQQPSAGGALAKLLVSNIPQSKPITVAVQPTPQTPTNTGAVSGTNTGTCNSSPISTNNNVVTSASSDSCSSTTTNASGTGGVASSEHPQTNPLGSPIMIQSPPSVSSATGNNPSNVNVNVNSTPNVSVNLNAITLDSLLAASSGSISYGTNATTFTTNQAGAAGNNIVATASNVNLGLGRIATSAGQPAVNILRLNNNAGNAITTTPGGNTVQLATLNGNVSILQQGRQQPQQRILINANSMSTVNNLSGEVDELSVPDLTTLLSGGQPIQISQLGQQQHILTNAATSVPSQTTIDTTNLNLNLNVNLNSGTVVNSGDSQVQQHQIAKIQAGEWTPAGQAPPFLVFISQLRPMSIATPAVTTVTRQITPSTATVNNSTLNVNMGGTGVQQPQSHQPQIVQSQPGKVPEGPTRILLGTCNNGVAIKREVATATTSCSSVTPSTTNSSTGEGTGESTNSGQNQVADSANAVVEGQLLGSQNLVGNSDVVVDGVDSVFHALSEFIGPEQLQKLDAIGGSVPANNTNNLSVSHNGGNVPSSSGGIAETTPAPTPVGINLVPSSSSVEVTTCSSLPSSSTVVSAVSNTSTTAKNNSTNVITLSDLLGSPTVVSSSTGNAGPSFPSLILNSVNSINSSSNSSPTLSSLLNSSTSTIAGLSSSSLSVSSAANVVTQSSIVSSTPRLSALLAGTPSADTVLVGTNGPSRIVTSAANMVDSSTGAAGESGYGNLLDRLAANLNQPQGIAAPVRTGTSRLNPIATATPSVVLEHPVLAATLTSQQQQLPGGSSAIVTRGTPNFRQIAPAPSSVSGLNSTTTTSIVGSSSGSSNVVISSADIQSPHLINLLGIVGNNAGASSPGRTRTFRITSTTSSSPTNPSPGSNSR